MAALVLLGALTCLLFAPALRPGSVFYFRDISQTHHPYREFTIAMMRSGEVPLWNPVRNAGQPLLANPNSVLLHPTTLLFFVLPFEWAFRLSIVSQVFLAAIGTWLLLRDRGAGRVASIVGACTFAFSGCLLSLGNLLIHLNAAACLPLTLWLAGRALRLGFSPWGALAALSLAVQILAGEPAFLLMTVLAFAASYPAFVRGSAPGAPSFPRQVVLTAGILGLAALLAMIGLLPGAEMMAHSERSVGFVANESMRWSIPPAVWGEVVVRGLFGDPSRTRLDEWWGGHLHETRLPFLLSLYLGPGVLLLAGAGLASGWRAGGGRRMESLTHAGLAAGSVVLALGRFFPVYPALISLVPALSSVRYPAKYAILLAWAAAILAARGYDDLASRSDRPLPWRSFLAVPDRRALLIGAGVAALAFLVALTGLFGWTAAFARDATAGGSADLAPRVAARMEGSMIEAAVITAVVAMAMLIRRRLLTPAVLAVVPIGMLMIAGMGVNPVAPSDFYTRRPELLDLVAAPEQGRVWAAPRPHGFAYRPSQEPEPDRLLWEFLSDRLALRNLSSLPVNLRLVYDRSSDRLDILPGIVVEHLLTRRTRGNRITEADVRLLEVAGVERVLLYGDPPGLPGWTEVGRLQGIGNMPVSVVSVPGVPRVQALTRTEVQPDAKRAIWRLQQPSFDPLTTVVLEEGRVLSGPGEPLPGKALIEEDRPSTVRIRAQLPADGYVVLADTFYPGWKATVDGRGERIIRANAMFRAVAVPAGEHEVTFSYEPTSVRIGAIVSAAALLAAILLMWIPRRMTGWRASA